MPRPSNGKERNSSTSLLLLEFFRSNSSLPLVLVLGFYTCTCTCTTVSYLRRLLSSLLHPDATRHNPPHHTPTPTHSPYTPRSYTGSDVTRYTITLSSSTPDKNTDTARPPSMLLTRDPLIDPPKSRASVEFHRKRCRYRWTSPPSVSQTRPTWATLGRFCFRNWTRFPVLPRSAPQRNALSPAELFFLPCSQFLKQKKDLVPDARAGWALFKSAFANCNPTLWILYE